MIIVKIIAARGLFDSNEYKTGELLCSVRVGHTKFIVPGTNSGTEFIWNKVLSFDLGSSYSINIKLLLHLNDGKIYPLGYLVLKLDNFPLGTDVTSWYKVQNSENGEIHISVINQNNQPVCQPPILPNNPIPNPFAQPSNINNPFANLNFANNNPFQGAVNPFLPKKSTNVFPTPINTLNITPRTSPNESPSHSPVLPVSPPLFNSPPQQIPLFVPNSEFVNNQNIQPIPQPMRIDTPISNIPVNQNTQILHFPPESVVRDIPPIGQGSFGVVYKGRVVGIDKTIVVKDLEVQNQRGIEAWTKEVSVMSLLQSPYLAEVYGYSIQPRLLTIIMEYIPLGNLFDILHKTTEIPLSFFQRLRMSMHVSLAVKTLHFHSIAHRDIKSLNILVTEDYGCKLGDFGCAKIISDMSLVHTLAKGSLLWMAPEVSSGYYSISADIYSLGLVLYELFERKIPDWNETAKVVVLPKYFTSSSIVVPCINRNHDSRPKASQVVEELRTSTQRCLHALFNKLPENDKTILKKVIELESNIDKQIMQFNIFFVSKPPIEQLNYENIILETFFRNNRFDIHSPKHQNGSTKKLANQSADQENGIKKVPKIDPDTVLLETQSEDERNIIVEPEKQNGQKFVFDIFQPESDGHHQNHHQNHVLIKKTKKRSKSKKLDKPDKQEKLDKKKKAKQGNMEEKMTDEVVPLNLSQ